jgi:hypothetical protein
MFVSYSHHINVFWAFFSFHVWHFSVVILHCYIIGLFEFSFIRIFYLGCWSWALGNLKRSFIGKEDWRL